jgi:hypothetical protein
LTVPGTNGPSQLDHVYGLEPGQVQCLICGDVTEETHIDTYIQIPPFPQLRIMCLGCAAAVAILYVSATEPGAR